MAFLADKDPGLPWKSEPPTSKVPVTDTLLSNHVLQLPNELLLEIFNHLPISSQLSLRHVSRQLYCCTPALHPPEPSQRTACQRNALARVNKDNINLRSGKRLCITCGELAPLSRFRSEIVPICKWHDGWFMKRDIPEHVEPELQAKLSKLPRDLECWIALERTYCAHRKDITHWDIDDCNCQCDFCGHFSIVCYVRISASDGRGRILDLVEYGGGTEVAETRRQQSPYGMRQATRMRVVSLDDL